MPPVESAAVPILADKMAIQALVITIDVIIASWI